MCQNLGIDFETAGNGARLHAGAYVGQDWYSQYGMTVSATKTNGGYTPGNKPRLFDTSRPGTNNNNGDPDLGSPNQSCWPSGPGVGNGGKPSSAYKNCKAQGLVLIIQESNKYAWDDNAHGGIITFDFATPVDKVFSIGLMDIEERTTYVDVRLSNGQSRRFTSAAAGDNSVQTININMSSVKQVKVTFGGSGAITDLNLCAKRK